MQTLKKKLQQTLESNDLADIVVLAQNDRRVLSLLIRVAYDKDTLAGRRAIKAVGLIAQELVSTDPGFLRETCRKLLWSLSDESGSIGWSAPELLGEIVAADPKRFADIIPLIASVYETEEDVFRPGVLYALTKVAEKTPELVLQHADVVLRGLSDPNPLARAFALQCLQSIHGLLGGPILEEVRKAVQALTHDLAEAWIYKGNDFIAIDLGRKAQEVLSRLYAK